MKADVVDVLFLLDQLQEIVHLEKSQRCQAMQSLVLRECTCTITVALYVHCYDVAYSTMYDVIASPSPRWVPPGWSPGARGEHRLAGASAPWCAVTEGGDSEMGHPLSLRGGGSLHCRPPCTGQTASLLEHSSVVVQQWLLLGGPLIIRAYFIS